MSERIAESPALTTPESQHPGQFTIADMDTLRDKQLELYVDKVIMAPMRFDVTTKREEALGLIGDMNVQVLEQRGITEDHPRRAQYETLLANYSLGKVPSNRWDLGPDDEYGVATEGARYSFDRELRELQDVNPVTREQPVVKQELAKPVDPELNQAIRDELDQTRKRFSELLAERSKRFFESSKTTAKIDASFEELTDIINATATEMMDSLSTKGVDHATMAAEIDAFTKTQADIAVEEMQALRASDYLKRSARVRGWLDKWSSWGSKGDEKFFSKERFKGNLKKGAVFAVPGLAVAGIAAPFVGAVTGVAVVGIGAGYVGRKIGRSLAGAKLDSISDSVSIAEKQSEDISARMDELEPDAIHSDLLSVMKERSEAYRKRNQKRLIGGIAISMVAGAAGAAIGDAVADQFSERSWQGGKIDDWLKDKFDGDKNPIESTPKVPGHVPTEPNEPGGGDHHVDKPDGTKVITKEGLSWADFSPEAHTVTSGEGWYQTLKELGVPKKDWADVLEDAGPKLEKEGLAYFDKTHNEWRISDKGKLPLKGLKILVASSKKSGVTLAA